jgi:hypothetical protein
MKLIVPLLFAAALLPLSACGDDATEASVEAYCDQSAELDEAGGEAFSALEEDPDATEQDYLDAEKEFIEDHRSELEELRDVAPDEIRDDVDTLIQGLLDIVDTGEDAREGNEEFAAAEERVVAFEDANCGDA